MAREALEYRESIRRTLMVAIRQIFAVTELNLRGLPQRFWNSLVIVVGIASVVGVLLSILSYATGLAGTFASAGDPRRAIVITSGSRDESGQQITREEALAILNAPGIQRDEDGEPIASTENVNNVPVTRVDNQIPVRMVLRGVGPKAFALRPEFKLVDGRMFQPGTRELLVGTAAQTQFQNLALGDRVSMPDGEWEIVGAFETGGDLIEGQLLGDIDTVIASRNSAGYGSLSVRLESPESFDMFAEALGSNPALNVEVHRQPEFYARNGGQFAALFSTLAYFLGTIIAVGALFGTVNIMHSSVALCTREIAILRALGFGAAPVAISVLIEAMLLAIVGALIGAGVAWVLFDGNRNSFGGFVVFDLAVTPAILSVGLSWALVIALLGAIVPAIRAARLRVVNALRGN
jgi:putative ABC transport system permease protein